MTSNSDLEATIAALETQVVAPQPSSRGRTTQPTAPSSREPLAILDITTQDAGIGDGTFYAYVEVINQSSRTFDYVGLDGTCRDASGRVVTKGIGNTLNLAPGETRVITVIFLSAAGCTDIEVEFDSLTGLIRGRHQGPVARL